MESESKIMGCVSKKVAEELHLEEQTGKTIKLTPPLFEHIAKHSEEYENVDSCLYTLANLTEIINNPEYTYFNKKNNSIEYYKFLKEYVSVIVKVTNKKNLFIASVYPVKKTKIDNRLERKNWEDYLLADETIKENKTEKETLKN